MSKKLRAPKAAVSRRSDAGLLLDGGSNMYQHPVLPPALIKECRQLFDHFNSDASLGLSSTELRDALRAMGLEYTENQVKDLMFNLSQSAAVRSRNKQVGLNRGLKSEGSAACDTQSEAAGTVATTTALTVDSGSVEDFYLSFEKFVELLTITLDDCDKDQEFAAAFQVMDVDQDGVISAADLKATMKSVGAQSLHDEEIQEMLNEADWDDDKLVTLEDFKNVLDTN
mmetsp:Transcript_42521/g.71847  ORF Transcript_42521/g.71847 Transcript_42521/m.71847 type:complete len:227 (-) Transcript_42521:78-758(-)